jgi:hypothetical protein
MDASYGSCVSVPHSADSRRRSNRLQGSLAAVLTARVRRPAIALAVSAMVLAGLAPATWRLTSSP